MKILSVILLSMFAMSFVAVAQDTNKAQPTEPQKPKMEQRGERKGMGPMMFQGERGGPRGPMFRGGRGPQGGPPQQGPVVSPNDREEEWEAILEARRSEFKHQLNPSGPYPGPRGPMGPMLRGGQERPIVIVIQCPCQQQGKKFQKRHQFRGGR